MKIKTPNPFIYHAVHLIIYPFMKIFFRLTIDRSNFQAPKGSFMVISNHQSFMDFILVMLAIFPHRPNVVTAQKFFFYHSLRGILSSMGCIPKNLFEPDPRAIRGIMSVRKREGKLLLFPEGRCSVDGSYMGINKSTGKLVKLFNAPVVHCHIEGSYLCMPFWRKGIRFGDVRVTLTNILTKEDIKHQTVDEINQLLDYKLSGADIVPPASSFRVFPGKKLAKGLENIIYYCPKCRKEFTLRTKGNDIYCTSCANRGTMERRGNLIASSGSIIPTTVASWYREQVLYEIDALDKEGKFLEGAVIVRMPLPKKSGLLPCGEGWISLDETGWTFKGNLLDEEVTLFFPIESVPAIPFDPNDNFQIYANGNFYAFTPKGDKSSCAKYVTIGECAYWRFAHTVQMTGSGGSGFSRGRNDFEHISPEQKIKASLGGWEDKIVIADEKLQKTFSNEEQMSTKV